MNAKEMLEAAARKENGTVDLSTLDDPNILQKYTIFPKEDTPLHIAAFAGNLDFVNLMVKEKPSFAWDKNKNGLTPLHIASALGHLKVVQALLGLGSVSLCRLQDDQGRTPLHYAVMNGKIDVLKRLVSECPETLSTLTTDNDTPLHLAVKHKKKDTINALVEELGCFQKFIFKSLSSISEFAIQRKLFDFQNEGRRARLALGNLLINLTSHTDEKTLQVVATLIATMSFQAVARPPESIRTKDMELNYRCITAQHGFTSFLRCPTLNYLLFLASNTASFFFSSLLLVTFRKGVVAEVLLRASLVFLVFTYFLLLRSITPEDHLLYFISSFLFIVLYAVLVFDWLRKKIYFRTKSILQNQVPNPINVNPTSNMGNEQASSPVQEDIDHQI